MGWIGPTLLLTAQMLAVPLAARAEGTDAERAAQAQAACLSGDYAKGVSILAELYVSRRNPTYIFNQGRCFEQSGKYEEAIVRFREYQRKNASAGVAADPAAEEHIAECRQALLDKRKAAASPAPSPSAEAPPMAPTAVGIEAASQPARPTVAPLPTAGPTSAGPDANRMDLIQASPSTSQTQPESSIFHRWWFWTAVGAVVAGGVTAALLLSRGGAGGSTKPICTNCADSFEVNL